MGGRVSRRRATAVAALALGIGLAAACADLSGLTSGPGTDAGGGDVAPGPDGATSEGGSDAGSDGARADADAGTVIPSCDPPDAAGADASWVYLAAGESAPRAITVDDTTVFWTTGVQSAAGKVRSCAKAGCNGAPTTLGPADIVSPNITADGTNVYFGDGYTPGHVYSCPKTGCGDAAVPLASGEPAPYGVAFDNTNLYWGNAVAALNGNAIRTCLKTGCTASTLAANENVPRDVATDGAELFWPASGLVRKCPSVGCSGNVSTLAAGQGSVITPKLDATDVYWMSDSRYIRSCKKAGCNLSATDVYVHTQSNLRDFAMDAANLYILTPNSILSCSKSGCPNGPTLLLGGLPNPQRIVVDDTVGCAKAIFWTNDGDGSVRKLLR